MAGMFVERIPVMVMATERKIDVAVTAKPVCEKRVLN
jgi:hypothetical protein